MSRVLGVLAALAITMPARGQAPDPFLSVPARPSPAPAPPRPAPVPRPAPATTHTAITPPAITPKSPPSVAPAPPVATTFADKGFHCPVAGTVVIRDNANTVTYAGIDPTNPEACLVSLNGNAGSLLFGTRNKNGSAPADYSAAYRKVLSGPAGTTAEFRQDDMGGYSYINRLQNEASETLQIGGEARPTVRIAWTQRGIGANHFEGTWHQWFDVQTGAVIRQSYQHTSGNVPPNQDWTARSITVPKT